MAMRSSSTLRLIAPNKNPTHLLPRITATSRISYSMSDPVQSVADTSSDGKIVKAPEKAPDPPEKPLPDDCCGSGCVRCVWDVYYDQLEDYNKSITNHIIISGNKSV